MHIRPNEMLTLTREILEILTTTGAVHRVASESHDELFDTILEGEPQKKIAKWKRSWDLFDADIMSRSKAREQIVKWLRFSPDLDNSLMERIVALGVVGSMVWWNSLLFEILERTSTEKLGSGMYGAAFRVMHTKKVLKISVCSAGDSWHTFVRKVMDSEGNPFLPKIDGIWFWNDVTVAVMEELDKDELYKEDGGNMFRSLVIDKVPIETVIETLYIGPSTSNKTSSWLREVAEMVNDTIVETNGGIDMHNGNLMFRDGVPVLIDPVCGGTCPYADGMWQEHVKLRDQFHA